MNMKRKVLQEKKPAISIKLIPVFQVNNLSLGKRGAPFLDI